MGYVLRKLLRSGARLRFQYPDKKDGSAVDWSDKSRLLGHSVDLGRVEVFKK